MKWRAPMVAVALVGAASALVASIAACDAPLATTCKNVPPGGCPLSHGVACQDPECEAAYACTDDGWVLHHVCPARDAGRDANVVRDAALESASRDAAIDAPPGAYGGPGCGDLQAPDCALGVALGCTSGCCGCEDLFVCKKGGWSLWGICEGGQIKPR